MEPSHEGDSLNITVSKAEGIRCERCWRTVPTVCNMGICERCVSVCLEDGYIVPLASTKAEWADPNNRGKFKWAKEEIS